MVDVRDRRQRNPVEAELLELEAGHRPGRVLEQDLVDPELDLLLRLAGQMVGDDLLRERLGPPPEEPRPCSPSSSARWRERPFGALLVSVRFGLTRGVDQYAGAVAMLAIAFVLTAVVAIPSIVGSDVHAADLWKFAARRARRARAPRRSS